MERDDKRLAYQGKIEARLKEWGAQIDRLGENGNRTVQQNLMDDLNTKRQTVRRKLADLENASDDQWQRYQGEMDRAVQDMETAMNNLRDKSR